MCAFSTSTTYELPRCQNGVRYFNFIKLVSFNLEIRIISSSLLLVS